MNRKPITTEIIRAKKGKEVISMLTAYDFNSAKIFDEAGVDMLLVGDSLGNVVLGYTSTIPVTMEEMLHHVKAVSRANTCAMVVADMPFMSYQADTAQAITNAGRLLKEGGACAVKLEGGNSDIVHLIEKLTVCGIPVVAHLGLTPQSVNQLGGFKVQGKSAQAAQHLLDEAIAVAAAGAFALVLECVPAALAEHITNTIPIPTIGIGAGAECDGQVLVCNDMLGMNNGFVPKFVKKYRNLYQEMLEATKEYIDDINNRSFPAKEHTFAIKEEVLEKLY